MRFTSKRDFWPWVFIWISVLIPLVMFLKEKLWYGLIILILTAIFVAWVWLGTYYDITEKELKIRCGPIRETIFLDNVIRIRKIKNFVSSAALSIDRLEIRFGKYNFTYISPKDEEAFINIMKERCPGVEIDLSGVKR